MAGTFEVKESGTQYMFNLKAGNGQVILTSERYSTRQNAVLGIASVKKNSREDARFDRRQAGNEGAYFVLKAANGEIIGTSQQYSSASAMENGVESVKAHAPGAAITNLT